MSEPFSADEQTTMETHRHLRSAQSAPAAHLIPQIHELAFWASWRCAGAPVDVVRLRTDLRQLVSQVKSLIDAEVNTNLQCGQLHVLYGHLLQAQYHANLMSDTPVTLSSTARHQAGYAVPGETIRGN